MIFFLPPFNQTPTTISYTHVAENCVDAISDLSKATGLKLRAAPAMRREVLLLALDHAPVQDVLARIAHACNGVWKQEADAQVLVRPTGYGLGTDDDSRFTPSADWAIAVKRAAIAAGQAKTYTAESAKLFALSLQAKLADEAKKEPGAPAGVSASNLVFTSHLRFPMDDAADAVFAKIPPKLLAAIPYGESRTFSNEPNAYEIQLPFDPLTIVSAAVAQQKMIASNMPKPEDEPSTNETENMPWSAPSGEIKKVDIIVSYTETVEFRLLLEDGNGKPIATCAGSSSFSPLLSPTSQPFTPLPKSFQVDPGPVASYFSTTLGMMDGVSVAVPPLPPAVETILSNPIKYEPLGRYPSRVLLAYAGSKHVNMVADIPDLYFLLDNFSKNIGQVLPAMLSGLVGKPGLVTTEPGWIDINAGQFPDDYRDDRAEMQQLFQSPGHNPSLEQLAHYESNLPRRKGFMQTLGENVLKGLNPAIPSLMLPHPRYMWKVLSLVLQRIDSGENMKSIRADEFPEALKKRIIEGLLYPASDSENTVGMTDTSLPIPPHAEGDVASLLNGGTIDVRYSEVEGVTDAPLTSNGVENFFAGPETLGAYLATEKLGSLDSYTRQHIDRPLVLINRRSVFLTGGSVLASGVYTYSVSDQFDEVHPLTGPLPLRQLPAAFLAKVDAAASAAVKAAKQKKGA